MRALLACLIALIASLGCAVTTPGNRPSQLPAELRIRALREAGVPRRVVLVTIAGLESSDWLTASGFLPGEDEAVRMPGLAQLAAEGAFGVSARPPTPGSSYGSHATLVTGVRPDRHGIFADELLDGASSRALPAWDSRLLRATTLWESALGRGVLALGWPTTDGARIELLVPDAEPDGAGADWLAFARARSSPPLITSLEAIAKRQLDATPRDPAGNRRTRAGWPTADERDAAFVETACDVAGSERDPALWLIRLVEPARVLTLQGHGTREHAAALARADAHVARLLACLAEHDRLADTALFVVGDVVYRSTPTEIAPNAVLARENLIGRDPRSSTGVRSWLAAAHSHGRSAYVYAKDADDALAARRVLEREATRSLAFDVVAAADLAASGAARDAWFGLQARPGYRFGNALSGPLLRPSDVRSSPGGFALGDGAVASVGLIAWGRGIRAGMRVPELALVDVAPTIARLLGLRLDDTLDGRVLIGILRASQPLPPPGPKRLSGAGGADVEKTLREMGGGRDLGSDR